MTNDPTELKKLLAENEQDLREFEEWKKAGKPNGIWFHRSTGTWAKNAIREIKKKMREVKP